MKKLFLIGVTILSLCILPAWSASAQTNTTVQKTSPTTVQPLRTISPQEGRLVTDSELKNGKFGRQNSGGVACCTGFSSEGGGTGIGCASFEPPCPAGMFTFKLEE